MSFEYWDALTKEYWEKVEYPFRPQESDLLFLEKIKPEAKVLLLGATPEIRDFFSKRGQSITVVDYSQHSINEMGKFLNNGTKNEIQVTVNWFYFETEETFDYILGDLILNIIKKEAHEDLLLKFRKNLRPNGSIIFRTLSKGDILKLSSGNKKHLALYLSCYNNEIKSSLYGLICFILNIKRINNKIVYLD